MNKSKFISVVLVLFGILTIFIARTQYIRIQDYPFGYSAGRLQSSETSLDAYTVSEDIPNTSIYSYKVDINIRDKADFINFLKENATIYELGGSCNFAKYELGSFMDSNRIVNWQEVYNAVKVGKVGWKRTYTLQYRTLSPECNGYSIKMTEDGYILDSRSAGI